MSARERSPGMVWWNVSSATTGAMPVTDRPMSRDELARDPRALTALTSIVIPAFNEALAIGPVVAELRVIAPWHEIVVIDDGSSDATAADATSAGARVIRHP